MLSRLIKRFIPARQAQRRAIRKAAALPPNRQAITAVYAMGIRDGLQIAADIREKTRKAERNT